MRHHYPPSARRLPFLLTLLLLVLLSHCRLREQKLSEERSQLVFSDSTLWETLLLRDKKEGYFQRISLLDMGIQLDTCFPSGQERAPALQQLRTSLLRNARPFSEEEKQLLRAQFGVIRRWCLDLNPDLLPDTLFLVKVRGNHFGAGTFYTRKKAIILPEPALQNPHLPALRQTLLHELFHIYSRYHPEKREALYKLIGFQRAGERVRWPEVLQRRLLLNPDGLDDRYAIQLSENDERAIPVLLSRDSCHVPGKSGYFSYIQFSLIPIDSVDQNGVIYPAAERQLDYQDFPSFFQQISDNTSYIIHPDEILADNFSLLLLSRYDPEQVEDLSLSGSGAQLLTEMENILQRGKDVQ